MKVRIVVLHVPSKTEWVGDIAEMNEEELNQWYEDVKGIARGSTTYFHLIGSNTTFHFGNNILKDCVIETHIID